MTGEYRTDPHGDHVHDMDTEGTWASMPDAPRDGRVVEGRYDNGEIVRIRWAEDRVCVLSTEAPGAGQFGPGWEDEANGLYVDDPESWRPLAEVADPTVGA
jgi:hypothetical protein